MLIAVLRTLVRATVDPRTPVVLRARHAWQAAVLAEWLASVHGNGRVVIASTTAHAAVVVRLPLRMFRPRWDGHVAALAWNHAAHHLSRMTLHDTDAGFR